MVIFSIFIGWEFVDAVMTSDQTFRGYVSVMNNRYRRYNDENVTFMSVNTFINWFFAWASRMNIEFREGCHYCFGAPSILACDGTKLGVSFKDCFVSPIETATKYAPDRFVQTRRHDRCFLCNRGEKEEEKRIFAAHRSNLGIVSIVAKKRVASDHPAVTSLREVIPPSCLPAFDLMVSSPNPSIRKAFALVFHLLSFDSAVDTIIPFRFCDDVLNNIKNAANNSLVHMISKMRTYSYELSHLVETSLSTDESTLNSCLSLISYCAEFVKICHINDVKADPPVPMLSSYNPPKFGRAYYFTDHGNQVREMRRFPIDGVNKTAIFDDAPDIRCEKRFPQVSKSGSSYLFLWFCPEHGHCFGFHIIPGSEGRKDPAASLYTHLETAPDTIVYDFACSLSEYCKNREAGFFSKSQFYHDVFHGYTHKCSPAFRCEKLAGFSKVNSSICEQFNSFIKKIENSSRLMSQCHFTFFLQFFIHRWNQMKKKNHERKDFINEALHFS